MSNNKSGAKGGTSGELLVNPGNPAGNDGATGGAAGLGIPGAQDARKLIAPNAGGLGFLKKNSMLPP